MNRINNPKVVYGGHLSLVRSNAGFVPSFVRFLLVPNQDCPIPIFFLYEDKLVLPPMDGRRFVKCRKKSEPPDDPIPPFSPTILAIPLNDVSIGESKGSALKALLFAGGHKGENRCPGIRDKLSYGNVVCMKNFHSDFGKRETESKF